MDGAMICAICDCRLFPDTKQKDQDKDVFALNPCGHVFHRECTRKWLDRNPTCPSCRSNVDNGRKLFFAADHYPADDMPGGSELEDEKEDDRDNMPWYKKYAETLIFAGGAIFGAVAAGVVATTVTKKREKSEEKK